MEGNDIEDLGGGSFRTVAAVQRYSLLDQYAMGLVAGVAGAAVLLRREPDEHVADPRRARIAPAVGVTFNGTRRDVLIQDVDRGPRGPRPVAGRDIAESTVRPSSIVRLAGRTLDTGQVAKIDRIRREWGTFFRRADRADAGGYDAATGLRPPT